MLYESDIANLLSQWQKRLDSNVNGQSYKDCLSDCIYDLNCLIDKNFAEEALANESFEQEIKEDDNHWEEYFNSLIENGIFAQ